MATFLIIAGAIILILFLLGKGAQKANNKPQVDIDADSYLQDIFSEDEAPTLYKKRGIKTFEMKGMYYNNLSPETHTGEFIGTAFCEESIYDDYAVAIYNDNSELLGYTPKNNKRLSNSLSEWHNGEAPAWGRLFYNDYEDRWSGTVCISVGLSNEKQAKVCQVLKLISENQLLIKSKKKYDTILNNHQEITRLLKTLSTPKELNYSFPKNLIPAISSYYEKEKKWDKLLALDEHQDLISELSERYKKATLKRIEKAKEIDVR